MRTIRTFILRLLEDTDDPQALRGMIRAIAGAEEHTFADGPTLLALLLQMMGRTTDVGRPERHCDSGTAF